MVLRREHCSTFMLNASVIVCFQDSFFGVKVFFANFLAPFLKIVCGYTCETYEPVRDFFLDTKTLPIF